MKIRNKILAAMIIGSLAIISCDSQLDIDPQQSIDSDIALNTSDNVVSVLIGAYNGLSDDDMFGGQYQLEADLLANSNTASEVTWTGSFEEPEQIWQKSILVENGQVSQTWLASYNTINLANNVLSALDVVDAGIRDRVEGEAKFIRGITYFNLLKLYAQPHSAGSVSSNLGVPIVTEPTTSITEDDNVSRGTVEAGYALVISDLTDAESLLPATNGVFANASAAAAILSRVYLQQENYTGARDAANRVIGSGNYSLTGTYAGAFNAGSNTTEDVFSIQISEQDGANSLNLFYAGSSFGGRGDVDINNTHVNLYEAGDDRLNLFYIDGARRSGKWMDQFANIGVIRLAEMYLTRAEGNFRLTEAVGDTPLNDINLIRNRVNLPDLLITDLDIDAILFERKLELMFEGQLLHDLKRTQRSIGNIPFDADRIVYPIPQRERDANPNLEQNDGYN